MPTATANLKINEKSFLRFMMFYDSRKEENREGDKKILTGKRQGE